MTSRLWKTLCLFRCVVQKLSKHRAIQTANHQDEPVGLVARRGPWKWERELLLTRPLSLLPVVMMRAR